MKIKATGDNILCRDGDFGDTTTASGIVVKSSTGTSDGIVPRWFRVLSVGPDIYDLKEDDWVLVEYNQWTEGVEIEDERLELRDKIWKINPEACLMVSDEKPTTNNLASNAIDAPKKILE